MWIATHHICIYVHMWITTLPVPGHNSHIKKRISTQPLYKQHKYIHIYIYIYLFIHKASRTSQTSETSITSCDNSSATAGRSPPHGKTNKKENNIAEFDGALSLGSAACIPKHQNEPPGCFSGIPMCQYSWWPPGHAEPSIVWNLNLMTWANIHLLKNARHCNSLYLRNVE